MNREECPDWCKIYEHGVGQDWLDLKNRGGWNNFAQCHPPPGILLPKNNNLVNISYFYLTFSSQGSVSSSASEFVLQVKQLKPNAVEMNWRRKMREMSIGKCINIILGGRNLLPVDPFWDGRIDQMGDGWMEAEASLH
jgi:hypothetical protein